MYGAKFDDLSLKEHPSRESADVINGGNVVEKYNFKEHFATVSYIKRSIGDVFETRTNTVLADNIRF